MLNYLITFCSLIFIYSFSFAQGDSTRKFCDPKLEGMARSKGVVILYERVLDSEVTSTSPDTSIGNGSAIIGRNNKVDFKIKIPVWNRPNLKIIFGLKYFFEEFNFKTPEGLEYPLYKNLEDKNLKSIGGNINVLKPLNETQYVAGKFNVDLNGDYTADEFPTKSFLKYSFAAIYGWKKCETKTMGFGVYYSYTFGRRGIYPVMVYANTFNKHWGLEALFPASVKVRYNISEKTLLYGGYEVDGASYHIKIKNPPFANYPSMELRRSNLRFTIDFEQEIYDFIWFGITAGVRQPLSMNLAKEGSKKSDDDLITNDVAFAPFFNASIFIVPPRTLENKILYGGK